MFAILMKSSHEVAIIDIGEVTMPALYMKEEHASKVLYKNDLDSMCYVAQVNPKIYTMGSDDDSNDSKSTSSND